MAERNNDCDVELLLAAKFIAEKAQNVYINEKGIKKMALEVMSLLIESVTFVSSEALQKTSNMTYLITNEFIREQNFYPHPYDSRAINWLFVLHTLNFSLWNPKDTKQWTVDGKQGFVGLCHAVKRAMDKNLPLWKATCYTKMTQNEFEYVFRSDDGETTIPLIHERLRILREVGEVLLSKYKGNFMECIKSSGYDADKLMKLLFDEFESYRDEAVFEGLKVCFHSKARALVSDIWTYLKRCNTKFELDTKNMMSTIFINYHAVQVLLHFKVLRYSDILVTRLTNSNEPLEYGSREEVEIRGCSLYALTKVCEEVQRISSSHIEKIPILKSKTFSALMLVDNFLLLYLNDAYKDIVKQEPFHYIRTIHY